MLEGTEQRTERFLMFRKQSLDAFRFFFKQQYPLGLPLTSLRDLPLLFVYFQANNGVLYYLELLKISTSGPSLFSFQPLTQILYLPLLKVPVAPVAQRYLVTL